MFESRSMHLVHLRMNLRRNWEKGVPCLYKGTVRRAAKLWNVRQWEVEQLLAELEGEGFLVVDEGSDLISPGEGPE